MQIHTYFCVFCAILFSTALTAQCPANTFRADGDIGAPNFLNIGVSTRDQPNTLFGPLEGVDPGDFITLEGAQSGRVYTVTAGTQLTLRDDDGTVLEQTSNSAGDLIVQFIATSTDGATVEKDFGIYLEPGMCGEQGVGPDNVLVTCTTCPPITTTLGTVVVFDPAGAPPIYQTFSNYDPNNTVAPSSRAPERAAWKNWYNPFGQSPSLVTVERGVPISFTPRAGEDRLLINLRDVVLNNDGYGRSFGTDGFGASLYGLTIDGAYVVLSSAYQRRSSGNNPGFGLALDLTPATGYAGYFVGFWRARGIQETIGSAIGTFNYPGNVAEFDFNFSYPPPPPPPPPADRCVNAVTVVPTDSPACPPELDSIYTAYANFEGTDISATCAPSNVYLTFTATSTQHQLYLENTGEFQYDLRVEVMSGSCTALTQVQCVDVQSGETAQLNDLTVGDQYFIRLQNFTEGSPQFNAGDEDLNYVKYCLYGTPVTCLRPQYEVLADSCLNQQSATLSLAVNTLGGQPSFELVDVRTATAYGTVSSTGTSTFSVPSGTVTLQLRGAEPACYGEPFTLQNRCFGVQNDECADYFDVPISTAADPAFIFANARRITPSNPAVASCALMGEPDMWFRVLNDSPETTDLAIVMETGDELLETYEYDFYTGTCGSLTAQFCTEGQNATFSLPANTTLYIRAVQLESRLAPFDTGVRIAAYPINGAVNEACESATPVAVAPDLTCANPVSDDNSDAVGRSLWYTFTPGIERVLLNLDTIISINPDLLALDYRILNACDGAELATGSLGGGGGVEVDGLTANQAYFLELSPSIALEAVAYTFCLTTPPPNATNSTPETAILTPVNPLGSCASSTPATTYGAEQFFFSCAGGTRDDDVFFKFAATTTAVQVSVRQLQLLTGDDDEVAIQVGTFDEFGGFRTKVCQAATEVTASGLNLGDTVYVSVYTLGDGAAVRFDLCVEGIPAPENDACANATNLTATALGDCAQEVAGTFVGANGSAEGEGTCPQTDKADVWYTFTAEANRSYVLRIEDNFSTDIAIWEGSCGDLSDVILCSARDQALISAAPAQRTLTVRLSTFEFTIDKDFRVCLNWVPEDLPVNDACTAAITLAPAPVGQCNATAGTTLNATSNLNDCDGDPSSGDVWYTFTATGAEQLLLIQNYRSAVEVGFPAPTYELLAGSCGSFTQLACETTFERDVQRLLTGLTVGDTYYLRIFSDDAFPLDFDICLQLTDPPANDERAAARTLIQEPVLLYEAATLAFATESQAAIACGASPAGTANNDVWFKFKAASSDPTIQLDNDFGPTLALELFDANEQLLGCFEPSFFSFFPRIEASGLTVGDEYFFRVYSRDGDDLIGAEAAFNVAVFGYEADGVLTLPADNCVEAPDLVLTGSERWRYAVEGTDVLAGIFDGEPLGNVATGVYGYGGPTLFDANGRPYLRRTLRLSVENQPANGPVRMALFFTEAELTSLEEAAMTTIDLEDLRFTKFNAEACSIFLPFLAGQLVTPDTVRRLPSGDIIVIASVDAFSSFYVHTGEDPLVAAVSLPVVCASFSAEAHGNLHRLTWATEAEKGHATWHLESSQDLVSWRRLTSIAGLGNTDSGHQYKLDVDADLTAEVVYYRLMAESLDGYTEQVCGIQRLSAQPHPAPGVSIYPNPIAAASELTVRISDMSEGAASIEVLDQIGRPILAQPVHLSGGTNQRQLRLPAKLKSGVYMLRVRTGRLAVVERFIVR